MARNALVLLATAIAACGVVVGGSSRPSPPRPRPASRPSVIAFPPASAPPATRPGPATARSVCRAALAWFDRADGVVEKLIPLAERAADRLLAGGAMYAGGNGGFADEFDFRAGGFPFDKIWYGQKLESDDVLVVGAFRPNEMDNRHARIDFIARGYGKRFDDGLVVHLGGHDWPQVGRCLPMANARFWGDRLYLVDTGAPTGTSMVDLCLGQMSATALGWALHGEIIAAATRRGKTLATYASDWEPNGRQWDASVRGRHLHPKYKVPRIPPGKIGREYLKICRGQVARFLGTQTGQVRLAGRRMARCMADGGVVWTVAASHVIPRGAVVPRPLTRLKMFGRSYDWRYFSRRIPAGDMVLWMGYLRYPTGAVRAARGRGCDIVVVVVDDGPTNEHVTHVRGCWKDFDTVIDLPEYPIRVLPSSGVLHTVHWYALMAETLAAARRTTPKAGADQQPAPTPQPNR